MSLPGIPEKDKFEYEIIISQNRKRMSNNFFTNKKILVTGHLGFLGSNLTKKLLKRKSDVIGVDKKSKNHKSILSHNEIQRIKSIKGNISNYKFISKIIRDYEIEYIFHLAAEAIVGKCFQKPLTAFSSNIKGTWNILEACRNSPVKAIIIASSDKAYGDNLNLPYKESYPLDGRHPYDVSKSCADLIAQCYHETYKSPVCITRCGNIYGPGDFNFSRLIPDAIICTLKNKYFYVRSDGTYTRDYIYIDDIIDAYLVLAEKMSEEKISGQAFNFSNEKPISVMELLLLIYKIINKKPKYKIADMAKHEIKNQYLSAKKAQKVLGWKPKFSLNKGLVNTVNWYRYYFRIT